MAATAWLFGWITSATTATLPIARNGAQFRSATGVVEVAPNWVWVLGFTLFGLVTGACYGARCMRRPPVRRVEASGG